MRKSWKNYFLLNVKLRFRSSLLNIFPQFSKRISSLSPDHCQLPGGGSVVRGSPRVGGTAAPPRCRGSRGSEVSRCPTQAMPPPQRPGGSPGSTNLTLLLKLWNIWINKRLCLSIFLLNLLDLLCCKPQLVERVKPWSSMNNFPRN